jgi:hypothetical protein
MPNVNASLWPYNPSILPAASADAPWGMGEAIEIQARLWNQMLDANRSFWSVYAPWLQMTPWVVNSVIAPLERDETGEEPAQTVDGIPDALESQARSWNHFIDAHRSFWTALNWPMPGAPWTDAGNEAAPSSKTADVIDMPQKQRARPKARAGKTTARRSR